MTAWKRQRVAPITNLGSGVGIILDPDCLVEINDVGLEGVETRIAQDWWSLRCGWESEGRRRPTSLPPLALVARGAAALTALPWDIERGSKTIVTTRLPGSPAVRQVLSDLQPDEFDQVIGTVEAAGGAPEALLDVLLGVSLSNRMDLHAQLRTCCRITLRSDLPALVDVALPYITIPELRTWIRSPSESATIEALWAAAVEDRDGQWASAFSACQPEMGALFARSSLKPVVASEYPQWAVVGVRSPSDDELVLDLLQEVPGTEEPTTAAGWIEVATWWAHVRSLLPHAAPETRERGWSAWADLDRSFSHWLRIGYGSVLSSASRWPSALHRVAHALARRLRDGEAERTLLIVLDGLGHAQWQHLRARLGFAFEEGSTFSMIPTYTTVSRQAIFAGELPLAFLDSIWTTSKEGSHWERFWVAQGLPVTATAYHRVAGRFPQDRIDFGAARAVGVVVNAVDDLMHSSELLGDAQLLAGLEVWRQNGFLSDLIQRATEARFDVWITADHGNLECIGARSPSEGLAVESAGKRLLRFANRRLRDASAAGGLVWNDVPGLGESVSASLMYASGRTAYTSNALSVSHGGLSFDEVIVPLVRVAS